VSVWNGLDDQQTCCGTIKRSVNDPDLPDAPAAIGGLPFVLFMADRSRVTIRRGWARSDA
jgi:hypothetical protein